MTFLFVFVVGPKCNERGLFGGGTNLCVINNHKNTILSRLIQRNKSEWAHLNWIRLNAQSKKWLTRNSCSSCGMFGNTTSCVPVTKSHKMAAFDVIVAKIVAHFDTSNPSTSFSTWNSRTGIVSSIEVCNCTPSRWFCSCWWKICDKSHKRAYPSVPPLIIRYCGGAFDAVSTQKIRTHF